MQLTYQQFQVFVYFEAKNGQGKTSKHPKISLELPVNNQEAYFHL